MNPTDTAPASLPTPQDQRTDLSQLTDTELVSMVGKSWINFRETATAVLVEYQRRGKTPNQLVKDLQAGGWTGGKNRVLSLATTLRKEGLLPPATQGKRRDLEVPESGTSEWTDEQCIQERCPSSMEEWFALKKAAPLFFREWCNAIRAEIASRPWPGHEAPEEEKEAYRAARKRGGEPLIATIKTILRPMLDVHASYTAIKELCREDKVMFGVEAWVAFMEENGLGWTSAADLAKAEDLADDVRESIVDEVDGSTPEVLASAVLPLMDVLDEFDPAAVDAWIAKRQG